VKFRRLLPWRNQSIKSCSEGRGERRVSVCPNRSAVAQEVSPDSLPPGFIFDLGSITIQQYYIAVLIWD
jgi:hypothetical protein